MKKSVIVVSLLLFILSSCSAQQKGTVNDTDSISLAYDMPTEFDKTTDEETKEDASFYDVILTSKVIAYELDPFRTDVTKKEVFYKHIIKDKEILTKTAQNYIQKLIADSSSYLEDGIVKYCMFTPELGIRFLSTSGDTIDFLVSMSCDILKIKGTSGTITRNFDPVSTKMKDFFNTTFIKVDKKETDTLKVKTYKTTLTDLNKSHTDEYESNLLYYTVKKYEGWEYICEAIQDEFGIELTVKELFELNDFDYSDVADLYPVEGDELIIEE